MTLQERNNFIVAVNNRYVDIFINGNHQYILKLCQLCTKYFKCMFKCSYKGYISNLRFYNYPLNLLNILYKEVGPIPIL